MKILVDMQGAQTESRFRGIGRYSTSLAQAMARNRGDHEIWLVANASLGDGVTELREAMAGLVPPERLQVFDSLGNVGWPDPANQWRRSAAELTREAFIANLQPDIVHVSSLFEGAQDAAVTSIGRLQRDITTAVTLYDLIPLLNSEVYLATHWTRAWYMDKIASLHNADLMLAISEHARSEALQALDIDPERVVNMSSAISPHFRPVPVGDEQRGRLRDRFGIRSGYIMYSGAMEPRKNADRLLQAFAQLEPSVRQELQLVIAGKVAPHDMSRFTAAAEAQGILQQVCFTGYITDEELILLYSAASLYVFPSLHEGFGLPALEAMACGAPTIGSGTTSIPEVIGRPDALFDPTDVPQMAAAMQRVLTDADFAASLREHALRQAAKFSWDRTATTAIAAFEDVVHRPRNPSIWSQARQHLGETYDRLVKQVGQLARGPDDATDDLAKLAHAIARNQERAELVARSGELSRQLRWRVEGPFDSSYSLALVNRELALALSERGHHVALHSTEGPGDFPADAKFLERNPSLAALHAHEPDLSAEQADVSSRLLYPPRVHDMSSRLNLLHLYAWEESGFPQAWVEDFNLHLQGIPCLSEHVRKVLIDNGVGVPLSTGGCGVDHWLRVETVHGYPLEARGFRFLHVSSCFPRKGADVLLQAYGAGFSDQDDVSLVIKTFKNPHNQIHEWLAQARQSRQDFPHVVIIEEDLSDGELKGLYEQCQVLVAPSRAEGFGLPMAEAMLSGLQVITTRWGGQLDFCNDETAWMVDYDFAPAATHFNLPLSAWAEPRMAALADVMREVWQAAPELLKRKVQNAQHLLRKHFSWADVAERVESSVRAFARNPPPVAPRIGWISSWNTRCGVAAYSQALVAPYAAPVTILAADADDRTALDGPQVQRCWRQGDGQTLDDVAQQVQLQGLDTLVIQFQYSFFDFAVLDAFIRQQKQHGVTVVMMMHATVDSPQTPLKRLSRLAEALSLCDRVLVHSIGDLNRLKAIGVIDNVALFPHGIMEPGEPNVSRPPGERGWRIASYGFFLPHKGLLELIETIGLMREQGNDVHLTMLNAEYPVPESRAQIEMVRERICQLGLQAHVSLQTDYLPDEETMTGLVAADLIVFPYQATGESSSAAVRHGLAAGRPVAVTPLAIFDDVSHLVHRLPGTLPAQMAQGLQALLNDIDAGGHEVERTRQAATQWRESHRYPAISHRLFTILQQLHRTSPSALTHSNVGVSL